MTSTLRIGLYSIDPIGLTPFHAFDPESYALVPTIADALIRIDIEGTVQPGLATSWQRRSPTLMDFELRKGVRFHNGEDFDADSVIATFDAHRSPTPSAVNNGILSPIASVRKLAPFRISIETVFPDAMLLSRLFWSEIYPKGVLAKHGRDYLRRQPVGTGAYRLARWDQGRELVLERNETHWANQATVDEIHLPIIRQKEWIDRLARGELDVAWNIDSSDRVRAARLPGLHVASRAAAVSQLFLLRDRGPLAQRDVRIALNHAINRSLLVELAEHGYGCPQRGLATPEQDGYVELEGFRHSPELSRALLEQAGFPNGFLLRGIVSETSTALFFAVKEFLSRVGVGLEAEIVPRTECIAKVLTGNIAGKPYDCDFAVMSVDNPVPSSLFHHFIFLFSTGPFSLIRNESYDREFRRAAVALDEGTSKQEIAAASRLEHYVRDEALFLFTVQQQAHAAWREGVEMQLPRNGHFSAASFLNLRMTQAGLASTPTAPNVVTGSKDVAALLDSTGQTGTFYLRPGVLFEDPALEKVWGNIVISEERWRVQNEPMLKELVSQVEAKTSLSNILGSTDRVAIVGYSYEARRLFVNSGYRVMFGDDHASVFELFEASGPRSWASIEAEVRARGAWLGHVEVNGQRKRLALVLSVTPIVSEEGIAIGYTFVFSDFTGEQERIKHEGIRSILDNVPYGLFMCDSAGCMQPGFSEASRRFFQSDIRVPVGIPLTELLALPPREAEHFEACFAMIIDDFMPEQVSIEQLPPRIHVGAKVCRLSASVIRSPDGPIKSVLFTLLDITELIEAEREVERLRSIVQVMRFKPGFEVFAHELVTSLSKLAQNSASPDFQLEARRALHTAKGVLAQFSLMDLARQIHEIEDAHDIQVRDLDEVQGAFRDLVHRNFVLWRIELDKPEDRFVAPDRLLRSLEERAERAKDLTEVRAIIAETLATIRERQIGELAGPFEENHDLTCQRMGKLSKFNLRGGDVTCPPHLAGVFGTLTHLVRNAVGHGVELPSQRGEKAVCATVELIAERSQAELTLTMTDDGRGIDVQQVGERAVALGVITPERLARLSHVEKLDLIFIDQISTASEVTETSGRGVGMSAVKAEVERLHGRIDVESTLGRGTRITIRLPLV